MNTKFLPLAFTVCALTVFSARAADRDLEKFQQQVLQLNTFCEGHPRIRAELSQLIKVDQTVVQKAVENGKFKASGVVAAQLIVEKTKKSAREVIAGRESIDWPAEFLKYGISLGDVVKHLENLNTELAFKALDGRSKKIQK